LFLNTKTLLKWPAQISPSTSERIYLSDILVRQRLIKADLDALKRLMEAQHTEILNLIRAQSKQPGFKNNKIIAETLLLA